eukprot:744625-Amphidinium_carterae.1
MAMDRHTETLSMQIISSFEVLQQQLDVLSEEQKQKTQGFTRTIAQRAKPHMTAEGNDELNLRRRVDLLTLELEKTQFELRTVTEQAKYMYRFATENRAHHERFQQRMREEAKRMCEIYIYISEERTRLFRETEQRYQGKVRDLQGQLERYQQQFSQRVRETVEQEVWQKSEQIVELQNQMRQGGDSREVAHLREKLALEQAKLEQLAWKEEVRARDVREARETILSGNSRHEETIAEVENLKSALADVIKESRNKEVSLSGTVCQRA